ncbi:MAG: ABC transporter ATP-binding protein [Acholeplasmataceae bacterium]|jgi:ABC-2 type transport system ATP-binding protein|nr:ABC transporter ATP-binding protein [Acholeplasmataceae bacterium]
MIYVENLRKYYGKTRGLESVTMQVNPGEIFGFVGPNGSGKTTLIRILLGLIQKDQGVAKVLGEDVFVGQYHVNEHISYMPSESFFFQELKVKQIIDFFQSLRNVDLTYLGRLINVLDIDLTKKFKNLSFGNKKKIGIVIALMHQPKLLILDEPTSGLDPLIQNRFLDLLIEQQKKGATILLSSHVLSEIEKVCDKVALIKDGEILFTKTIDDIKKDEHKKLIIKPINHKLDFEELVFVEDIEDKSYYVYQGDVNLLLSYLTGLSFEDLSLRDVTLEEIFSIYYEKEDLL